MLSCISLLICTCTHRDCFPLPQRTVRILLSADISTLSSRYVESPLAVCKTIQQAWLILPPFGLGNTTDTATAAAVAAAATTTIVLKSDHS